MSSTNKTEKLGLNQWIGSDIPQMADFNSDNSIIDSVCSNHINNSDIHITANERTAWNNPYKIGTYFGTGSSEREINCSFAPSFALVVAHGKSFGGSSTECYCAAAGTGYHTVGLSLTSTGFKVYNGSANAQNGCTPYLNYENQNYTYILFK